MNPLGADRTAAETVNSTCVPGQKLAKTVLLVKKVMAIIFWDPQGVISLGRSNADSAEKVPHASA